MDPFQLHFDPLGRLVLTDAGGHLHDGVEPIRAFPITDPQHGVSLCDAAGRELVWIDDLALVPPPARLVLEEALAQRQFLPQLRRILDILGSAEPTEWLVETDRGPTRFSVANDEDVRPLAGHRALVTDAHGIRYLVPDVPAFISPSSTGACP